MSDIGNPLLAHALVIFQSLRHGIKIGGQLPQFIPGFNVDAGAEQTGRQRLGSGRELADG